MSSRRRRSRSKPLAVLSIDIRIRQSVSRTELASCLPVAVGMPRFLNIYDYCCTAFNDKKTMKMTGYIGTHSKQTA